MYIPNKEHIETLWSTFARSISTKAVISAVLSSMILCLQTVGLEAANTNVLPLFVWSGECEDIRTFLDDDSPVLESTYQFGKISEVKIYTCQDYVPPFSNSQPYGGGQTTSDVIRMHCPETIIICNTAYHDIVEVRWQTTHISASKQITKVILIEDSFIEKFTFPLDYKVSCNDSGGRNIPPVTRFSEIAQLNCTVWKMSVTEETFRGGNLGDACYEILRTYEFLNSCRVDAIGGIPSTRPLPLDRSCADKNGDGLIYDESPVMIDWSSEPIIDLNFTYDDPNSDDPSHRLPVLGGTGPGGKNPLDVCQKYEFFTDNLHPKGAYRWVYDERGDPVLTTRNIYNRQLLEGGHFVYVQRLKIYDNIDPTVSISGETGCGDRETGLPTAEMDDCYDGWAIFNLSVMDICSSEPNISDWYINDNDENQYGFTREGLTFSGSGLSKGKYELHVKVADPCGNVVWASHTLEVVQDDCKKPTIICSTVFTAVMENSTVMIEAKSLILSMFDNCTNYDDLEENLQIHVIEDLNNDGEITSEDVGDVPQGTSVLVVSCIEYGYSTIPVAIWTQDTVGNTTYCTTKIEIQPGAIDPCSENPAAVVVGEITNENGEMISNVTVTALSSAMGTISDHIDGIFNFSLPMNSDVVIEPKKDLGYINGISTADVVQLRRHILGIKPITSAYKLIAGDVSGDNKVGTKDILHLKRMILGIYDEFPNADSWRFVPKNYQFNDPLQPWDFPETIDFISLSEDAKSDFIGIKIGDVTGNAISSNLEEQPSERTASLVFTIQERALESQDLIEIPVMANDFLDITGFQFTFSVNGNAELVGVEAGALPGMTQFNFGMHRLDEGILTSSWATEHGIDLDDGEVLFTLKVRPHSKMNISELVRIDSEVTHAEAYRDDLSELKIETKFIPIDEGQFILYQNNPNPFNGETKIGFELPEADFIRLQITDISGRLIYTLKGHYPQGYNTIQLTASNLESQGVLFYEMITSKGSKIKRMIVAE